MSIPSRKKNRLGNYFACFCDGYSVTPPKGVTSERKFGGLRFYMTCDTDEIFDLIEEAEALSLKPVRSVESREKRGMAAGFILTLR